jgi:hypothetical protein
MALAFPEAGAFPQMPSSFWLSSDRMRRRSLYGAVFRKVNVRLDLGAIGRQSELCRDLGDWICRAMPSGELIKARGV